MPHYPSQKIASSSSPTLFFNNRRTLLIHVLSLAFVLIIIAISIPTFNYIGEERAAASISEEIALGNKQIAESRRLRTRPMEENWQAYIQAKSLLPSDHQPFQFTAQVGLQPQVPPTKIVRSIAIAHADGFSINVSKRDTSSPPVADEEDSNADTRTDEEEMGPRKPIFSEGFSIAVVVIACLALLSLCVFVLRRDFEWLKDYLRWESGRTARGTRLSDEDVVELGGVGARRDIAR